MTDNKQTRRGHAKRPYISSQLNDAQLHTMEWLFPGFVAEYLATHDASGRPLPLEHVKIPLKYIGE